LNQLGNLTRGLVDVNVVGAGHELQADASQHAEHGEGGRVGVGVGPDGAVSDAVADVPSEQSAKPRVALGVDGTQGESCCMTAARAMDEHHGGTLTIYLEMDTRFTCYGIRHVTSPIAEQIGCGGSHGSSCVVQLAG
jgi:hypothetical protein